MGQSTANEAVQSQPRLAWWTLNLYLVGIFLVLWLILTTWGSLAVSDSSKGASNFLLSAQWVPLSYLLLVVVYGAIMNRCAAKYALNASRLNVPDAHAGSAGHPTAISQDV